MGREFELKFAATALDHEALRARFGNLSPITMETTYYDTPSGDIRRLRWTLRRRKENGVSVCALKTPGEGFGKCGEGYFRFSTFGSPSDTKEAARRLVELLKK